MHLFSHARRVAAAERRVTIQLLGERCMQLRVVPRCLVRIEKQHLQPTVCCFRANILVLVNNQTTQDTADGVSPSNSQFSTASVEPQNEPSLSSTTQKRRTKQEFRRKRRKLFLKFLKTLWMKKKRRKTALSGKPYSRFFLNLGRTVANFPPYWQAQVKSRVFQVVNSTEIMLLSNEHTLPSTSHPQYPPLTVTSTAVPIIPQYQIINLPPQPRRIAPFPDSNPLSPVYSSSSTPSPSIAHSQYPLPVVCASSPMSPTSQCQII